jgi:Replication factor-A C terminal domain
MPAQQGALCMQVRRYILNAAVADFSGERFLNFFNEQAQAVLGGIPADTLHGLKVSTRLPNVENAACCILYNV